MLKDELELTSSGDGERAFQQEKGTACAKAQTQRQERAWHTWAAPRGAGWVEHMVETRGDEESVARSQEDSGGWLRWRDWGAMEDGNR